MSSPSFISGFRYEHHVGGIGAPSHDTVSIFIPSKKLDISKDGCACRSECAVQSIKAADREKMLMDLFLENRKVAGREPNFAELDIFMRKAREIKDVDKETVQVPVVIADEIEALVKEREALEARQKAIDESIATLAKKLF